ncbi:MAG: restriction endonuclease subunit S [Bacteroidia bacterium]|nr:restriction endonuclease subunit S [Bacteroidia bacterium]
MKQNNIPKHWEVKKLGEVCEIKNGKNQKSVVNPNGKYPIYGSAGIMGYANDYLCESGATIIGRKGTINKPIYVKTKFWNVDTAFGFSPRTELINSRFLFFFCQSFNFHKLDKSTTIPSLAKTDLQKIELVLPPLPEQQAIVAKIEELLSELDNGKQQLQTAQQQLKVYRQSLLKWAFEGIKKPKSISVEDSCSHIVDCLHSTAKFTSSGYFCVDTTCIENSKILFNKIRYVNEQTYLERISRLKPESGDILFAREGTVGTTLIVPNKIELCLGQRMMMFRLKENVISKYFMYYLQSSLFKSQYQPLIMGTTAPHLNIGDVRKFKVVICSLEEQQLIVSELESKLTVCDKIEETISQSLQQAETLRQSILKQAFEGKLIDSELEIA